MNKHYIKLAIIGLVLSLSSALYSQTGYVSINLNGTASNNPAILDLSDVSNAHLGMLMPNVSLVSTSDIVTIPNPVVGTIIWNTNSGLPLGVGYYYWSGTAWLYVNNSGNSSSLGGAGTANYLARWTSASSLSTGVAQDNGTGVSISATALTPVNKLDVNGGAAFGTYAGSAGPANGLVVSGQTALGTTTPNASAALDITSLTQGLLPPRMNAIQMGNIVGPATGLLVFNTTAGCLDYFNGTTWQPVTCPCTGTPATPGAITGNTTFCGSSTGNTYSITAVVGALSYYWTVPPGATITAGQGTTSITVTFGTTSGNVTVTASNTCGTSPASTTAVTLTAVPATPGSITGTATICTFGQTGLVYSIAAVPGATSYNWTVPANIGTITANTGTSITITSAGSAAIGNITVTATDICGTSAASSLAVVLSATPATPGAITGTISYCNLYSNPGHVYSIAPVTNATSYTWTVPAGVGTITAGQGTTSITITLASSYGTGNITVTATDACGTSAASSLAVTVNGTPPTPGVITGTTSYCGFSSAGNTYSIAAVPGATSYNWTVPASVGTITANTGTSITITTASSAGTGNITVSATNGCGTSGLASLGVTINNPTPATPGAISGTTSYCNQYNNPGHVYSIAPVLYATSYNWTVPAAVGTITANTGTSITITTASSAGTGNITVSATDACGTSAVSSLAVLVAAVPVAPATPSGTASPAVSTSNTYTIAAVPGATSYTWTTSNSTLATVTAGGNTTSATITTTATAGTFTICVSATNACGTGPTSCLTVTSVTCVVSHSTATFTPTASPSQTGTIQSWTVPCGISSITITAYGAQGGDVNGGRGAEIEGSFAVSTGQIIKVIVGAQGSNNSAGYGGAGGGGSFVWNSSTGNTLMIAAGGGGGGVSQCTGEVGGIGSATITPTVGAGSGSGAGGAGGSGGTCGTSATAYGTGGGGCGWNSNGTTSIITHTEGNGGGGIDPLNGGTGGAAGVGTYVSGAGGFGGGGGEAGQCGAGGGGGGYNGGGGGNGFTSAWGSGGGGGSYDGGTVILAVGGTRLGGGLVTIQY